MPCIWISLRFRAGPTHALCRGVHDSWLIKVLLATITGQTSRAQCNGRLLYNSGFGSELVYHRERHLDQQEKAHSTQLQNTTRLPIRKHAVELLCTHERMCLYTGTHTCTYLHTYVHTYTCTFAYLHTHTCIQACAHRNLHTHVHIHKYKHKHITVSVMMFVYFHIVRFSCSQILICSNTSTSR